MKSVNTSSSVQQAVEADRSQDNEIEFILITGSAYLHEGLSEGPDIGERLSIRHWVSSAETAARAVALRPDAIVLLDTSLPGARDVCAHLSQRECVPKIIALNVQECPDDVLAWIERGAVGYVSSGLRLREMKASILAVARARQDCHPSVAAAVLQRLAMLRARLGHELRTTAEASISQLTVREQQIARRLTLGHSNKRIARDLGISLATTKTHVHNILSKLGVETRVALAVRQVDRSMDRQVTQPDG